MTRGYNSADYAVIPEREPFDLPLVLSLSKDERLAQDRPFASAALIQRPGPRYLLHLQP